MKTLGKLLLALVLLCLTAWGVAGLLIAGPADSHPTTILTACMGLLSLLAISRLWFCRGRGLSVVLVLAMAAVWLF